VGGEAPVTPVSSPDSSPWTFPTNRAITGPMTVASLNGYLYYVLFIDDHSRKTWIYFLKTKDGVLTRFQEFKAQVENLTGTRIKVLRSDNGGEYTSKNPVITQFVVRIKGRCKETNWRN
jgi:hypothetical protein